MIEIRDKKECCGCNACGDVCRHGAISFETDDEGFLYPVVDPSKCIKCGLCLKVCPQRQSGGDRAIQYDNPKSCAAVHRNLATRFDSTSGGAFSALANAVYRQKGFVGGAIWTDDYLVRQFLSDEKSDLARLRSSKYAQSDARGFFNAVKDAVKTGRPVLVCGTPCQMSALRLFLGKNTPPNLYVVDFICRGNNSPLVWRKYLDWHESLASSKIAYVKPKNKELGWRNLTTKLVFENRQVVYDTKETSLFTQGYLKTNAFCRPSCYACKYKKVPRCSDITLGDCWGAQGKLPPELDRDLGTSLVLINNDRGQELFNLAQESLLVQDLGWDVVRRGNPMLEESLPAAKCRRDVFFKILRSDGFGGIKSWLGKNDTCDRKSFKSRIHLGLRICRRVIGIVRSPLAFWRCVCHNGLLKVFLGEPLIRVLDGRTSVMVKGKLTLLGDLVLGTGFHKRSPVDSALTIAPGGEMIVRQSTTFMYGADIEVFAGGELVIEGGSGFNRDMTIVCGESIKIGKHVMCGRHVTIRDNNGGHWMNLPGYRNSRPVEIGDHAWLCEGCTIMPGVKVGAGAVVGAKAVVFQNVPANTLVLGNPAKVVSEQVEWKY